MLRLIHDHMGGSFLLIEIDHRFVVVGDSVGANDVVLDLSSPMWAAAFFAGVFGGQEWDELFFWWLFQVDLAETKDLFGVEGKDEVSGRVGLFSRENV